MGVLRLYLNFCRRFSWQILLALGLFTAGALFLASQLDIEADITRLLPRTAPSVAGLELLEKTYGGQIGRLTVVLEIEPPADSRPNILSIPTAIGAQKRPPVALKKLAEEYAVLLRDVEGVEHVEVRRPLDSLKGYRLLFAQMEDLRDAQAYLNQRFDQAEARANPLFVGLDDEADDAADATQSGSGDPMPELLDEERLAEKYPEFAQSPYYIAEDGGFLAFFVYPDFPPSDLGRASSLVDDVERIVTGRAERIAAAGGPKIRVGLTGRYKKRVDLEEMLKRDLSVSTSVALGVLLLFLWFYLRSFRATFLVLTPLVVGVIWTFAWASIAFGSLNIMTAFLGAVLIGLGADYGVHFFSRFRELRQKLAPQEALFEMLASTGRANMAAALTTMIALGSLMVSGFRAFYEFGVIAVGGLPLILLAYLLIFPCAVGVAERRGINLTARPGPKRAREAASGEGAKDAQNLDMRLLSWLQDGPVGMPMARLARAGLIARLLLFLLVVAAAIGLPRLRLNQDFSVLQSTSAPSWELDERINAMLGESQTPTLILTDSAQGSVQVVEELERRVARHKGPALVDKVLSLETFLPTDVAEKRKVLAQIARRLEEVPQDERDEALLRHLDEVEQVLRAKPLKEGDIPDEIRRQFSRLDSESKGVVLVFPAVELETVEVIDAWARILADLPGAEPGQGYGAISESFLLRDIVHTAKDDALWMFGITLLGLLLLSVLLLRDFTLFILQLCTLTLALLVALGINGLVGSHFNFMNIVALPVWLGLGVDASFHILLKGRRIYRGEEAGEIREYLSSHFHLMGAISVAYLTSMLGFGTLLLAQHNGLFSLGMVAIFGLGSILGVNLLIQSILVAESAYPRE
ncbi:hypothetical protein DFR33_10568 [Bradymonas sediminis]|uniref:Uncharacterized protein n=1 Tax=Bradymonas sediminis TaxID=1548548 RepID=A0A2Z4FQE6_9DELT|nr:hypothetical protein DN745_18315 [Bradymonas sediminis]TDP73736.1 hypothetical protein DFR33_10568 [Bradymonas sediminis]